MQLIRARVLGFCEGVRRAVEMAMSACEGVKSPETGVYMLGPLIHNSGVLRKLKSMGIKTIEETDISKLPESSTVIIRAHGIPPGVEKELRQRGMRILDATCPHVKASQNKSKGFAEEGCLVFLAGDKEHAEIAGIRGIVEESFEGATGFCRIIVIANPAEAAAAAAELFRSTVNARAVLPNTVLIAQTTINSEEYSLIGDAIKKFFPKLEILNTICGATADRQEALRELCVQVDALIVVGDRESANTRRLFSLARQLGKAAWLVEKLEDLPPEIKTYKTVGLSAGASSPDDLIDKIEEALTYA